MAKNAQETEALKKKAREQMEQNNARWSGDMSRIPLFGGETLTFTGDTTVIKSTTAGLPNWDAFITKEGYYIPFSQVLRHGNGIKFPESATGSIEACEAFIDKCCSMDDGLPLTLKEVKKIDSSSRVGKNTYYLFEPYEL